jgi:hypothetical protein
VRPLARIVRADHVIQRQHEVREREVVACEVGQSLEAAAMIVGPVTHRAARERHAERLRRVTHECGARRGVRSERRVRLVVGAAAEGRERLGAEQRPARPRVVPLGERRAQHERTRQVRDPRERIAVREHLEHVRGGRCGRGRHAHSLPAPLLDRHPTPRGTSTAFMRTTLRCIAANRFTASEHRFT